MNSSIEIDKTKYFLGYYYGIGKVLSLNIVPQPGMYFVNGETNSIWVWDALSRIWIDTNRVDSGMKGMLTDEEGNSPADFIPSPQVGVKESYFYVAKTDTPKEVVFTHFKNGNSSVSVNVSATSIVILYWNGSYWETSLIPMNIDLKEYATRAELSKVEEDITEIENRFFSPERNFTFTFTATYEQTTLPFMITKGAKVILSGDITEIIGREKETDTEYQTLKSGDVAERNISFIKNREELGVLNLTVEGQSFENKLAKTEREVDAVQTTVSKISQELIGGDIVSLLTLVENPARVDGSEVKSGYFKGYRVDLTPYIGRYAEVCFRGAEFVYPSLSSALTRGLILDAEGNVESIVPFVAEMSNGWQSLPITENSKTLWASYCTDSEGGEVWTPEYVMFKNKGEEGLLEKVDRIDNTIEVMLPSDIYLLKGKTSQLFFKGFIKAVNPYDYDIKVMCNAGKTFPRYYEIDGNVSVGDYPLTVQVRDNNFKTIGEASTTLHIIEQVVADAPKNILCIGASATATGCWAAELNRLLNNSNFSFVGRKQGTDEVVNLEATGGWSWSSFITADAPFPEGNFGEYANTYCKGKIDVLIAHIGVNNSLWENSDPQTAIADARTLIEGYFADFPDGGMIITAIPMPDEGTNVYGNTNSENNINRYGTLSSFLRYNKALYELVEELKSKYNISYVATNILFDTDYAYPKEYKSVNTRMDMFKEMVGVNGVHPIPEGSYMVSDAILPVFYEKIVK